MSPGGFNSRLALIHSGYLMSASIVTAAKQQALPLVVTLHDFWFVCPRITLLKPTGELCRIPKNGAECAWCLATEGRRFRWPEVVSRGVVGAMLLPLLDIPAAAKVLGIQPDARGIADRRKLLMNALQQADAILAPSEFLRQIFIEQGIDPEKIRHSRLGVDTNHWITPPAQEQTSSPDLRLTYIGQLAPHKGVHVLIEAFNRLGYSTRHAQLRIYGNPMAFPDYARRLTRMIRNNPAITLAGRFDNSRVAEILHQTDALVVPSIWYENLPVVILEALTTGVLVVASNLGGIPELIRHEVNGLLFEVGHVDDLRRQLQRLLDEPGLAALLASRAHPVRKIDEEAEEIVSIYESVRPT